MREGRGAGRALPWGALFSFVAACSGPQAPDVLLVTLDTTRADALGVYGQNPSPTPHIDAIAAEGGWAEEVMTTTPLTLPAHTSILSGEYPDKHGIRLNGEQVGGEVPLIAAELRAAGYATAAVVASVVLDSSFGLDRGFDTYLDGFDLSRVEAATDEDATRPGEEVATLADVEVRRADPRRPLFLWAHLYDPHEPLRPPLALRQRHADPYLAEVAAADEAVGRIERAMRGRGRPLVVVAVADHGEGRGEHGEATHGSRVYRSTMRVPLVYRGPDLPRGPAEGVRSVVDVAATIRKAAGVPALAVDGVALQLAGPSERRVYGETWHSRYALGLSEQRVWQDATARYIHGPRPELYNWRDDPRELDDRAAHAPAQIAAWAGHVASWDTRDGASTGRVSRDPALQLALARLGYLAGPRTAEGPLPDPKDHPDLQARVDAVVRLARTRPPGEAIPLLQDFIVDHPRVVVARQLLARALTLAGRPEEAREVVLALLSVTPDDPGATVMLAEIDLVLGRPSEALTTLRALPHRGPWVLAVEGAALRAAGRCAEALQVLDPVVAAEPQLAIASLVRGACRMELGDLAGAELDLRGVLERDPDHPDVRYLLGDLALRRGDPVGAAELLQEHLRRRPDAEIGRLALGLAKIALGDRPGGIQALRRAAASPQTGAAGPLALADALLADPATTGEVGALLDEAERREPGSRRVDEVRAAWLLSQGRTREAVDTMMRAGSTDGR